jgi:hypothetical protein
MTNPEQTPPENLPAVTHTVKVLTRKHHLNCIEKPITKEYAQQLWYIVSAACEGGLGGESWGWSTNRKSGIGGWKAYNEADQNNNHDTIYVDLKFVNHEDDEDLTGYIRVNAEFLHNKMIKFVNDEDQPAWLRKHYAEFLVTRETPDNADAVTADALMQYAFVDEIVFG